MFTSKLTYDVLRDWAALMYKLGFSPHPVWYQERLPDAYLLISPEVYLSEDG